MMTYWLIGRSDMSQANDSMVCKFKPRKKKKKKPEAKKLAPPGATEGDSASIATAVSTATLGTDATSLTPAQTPLPEVEGEKPQKTGGEEEKKEKEEKEETQRHQR